MTPAEKSRLADRLEHIRDYMRGSPEREFERRKMLAVTAQDFDLAVTIRDQKEEAVRAWNSRFEHYTPDMVLLDLEQSVRELRGV